MKDLRELSVPSTDEEVEQVFNAEYHKETGAILASLFRVHRKLGLGVLEAYRATLEAHIRASEPAVPCSSCDPKTLPA